MRKATVLAASALLLALSMLVLPTASPGHSLPPAASHQVPLRPAASVSNTYVDTLSAPHNASASTVTYNSAATWSGLNCESTESCEQITAAVPTFFSWNSSVAMAHIQSVAGQINLGLWGIGCVWANLTSGASKWSWSQCPNVFTLSSSHDVNCISPSWTIGTPGTVGPMQLTITESATDSYTSFYAAPSGLVSWSGSGACGYLGTAVHVDSAINTMWGWNWKGDALTSSTFNFVPGSGSGYITFVSPYTVNASYNSATQHAVTSGFFSGALAVQTISFQGSTADPANVYTFAPSYTVFSNVTYEFEAKLNYTKGGTTYHTNWSATSWVQVNATWTEYTYVIPTLFSTITKETVAGLNSWILVSASPQPNATYAGNDTLLWAGSSTTWMPSSVQVEWIAPTQYIPSTLTIVYVPTSPIFSLFGATLPYNAVLTYINGMFAPYQTSPAAVGQAYLITTFDVFGHLLSTRSVTENTTNQVTPISLNIWPMSVVNLNSSYVVFLTITHFSTSQTAPALMPLQTQVFFLPAGLYNFTIQYENFGGGSVGAPVTFPVNITGVSYDVVTGFSFLTIIATQTVLGNLITSLNLTLISTTAGLAGIINNFANGLFQYKLVAGVATVLGGVYQVPIFVTTGSGVRANYSATQQVERNLVLTFVNNTGTYSMPFFASGLAPGQFSLSFRPTTVQVSQIEGGQAALLVTSPIVFGPTTGMAAGVVYASVLATAVPPTGTGNGLAQTITLVVGNTTHNSQSGVYTSTVRWANNMNASFQGTINLIGSWTATAAYVSVVVNGTVLSTAQWVLQPNSLILFAGDLNVPVGAVVYINVSYQQISNMQVDTTVLATFGHFAITGPILFLMIAGVVVLAGTGYDLTRPKNEYGDYAIAGGLVFLIFGAMLFGV